MKHFTSFLVIVGWIAGIAIAKGFWPTLFALCCPPWAWYLIVEKLLRLLP